LPVISQISQWFKSPGDEARAAFFSPQAIVG
jgi:hypothetical protein